MHCARRRSARPDMGRMMPNIADHNISNHLSSAKGLHSPSNNYFNSAKNAVYSRYSTTDWEQSNRCNLTDADLQRTMSERLRTEALRAVRVTDQATRNRQESNTRKLDQRVKDIGFWREELLKEIHLMEEESANLVEHRRRLHQALVDTDIPLSVAEQCLSQREQRQGIDLVQDDLERCLTKEVEVIKKWQKQMQSLLEKVDIQLRMNSAVQNTCQSDLGNKNHAQVLDDRMQQLRNSSSRLGMFPGIEDVDNTVTVPVTWVKFTEENLAHSHHERDRSAKLRGAVDCLLQRAASEMWAQHNAVDSALSGRVHQLNAAKIGLHGNLTRLNNEILDLDRSMDLLRKAIADKQAPLKVAQTRLDERCRRIDVELCNDTPMAGLQLEVREILESIRLLNDQLHAAEKAMSRLMKSRAALAHDIAVKEASMEIDSQLCVNLRRSLGRTQAARTGTSFSMSLAG